MTDYRYYICDVFTDQRFGGNPLAVVPDARGLTPQQMQKIAREFNFSESTFVFPAESAEHHRKVRIFTPSREVPFAGHPNVGTAFALTDSGELELAPGQDTILFEEQAGVVPVKVIPQPQNKPLFSLQAPESLTLGTEIPVETVAQALSLDTKDIVVSNHVPQVASVGLAFVMVEVRDLSVLQRIKIDIPGFERIAECGVMPDVHVYCHSDDEFQIRSRMFAPFDGVNEDPATGSANSALAALLAKLDPDSSGSYQWQIAQGVEMKRPSVLSAFAQKKDGEVISCGVAGQAVMFSKGNLTI